MLLQADARHIPLADESVQCVVTSPPYWGLRDYGIEPSIWEKNHCSLAEHCWDIKIPGSNRGGSGTPTNKNNRGEDYGRDSERGQFCLHCNAWRGVLGLEPTPELYVEHIVEVFREVKRVLRKDGSCWVNLGDSYAANRSYQVVDNKHVDVGNNGGMSVPHGLKPKDLCGIPWKVAFALQADGWWLRSDIIWSKPNQMPESVTDRPTKSHEYIFLLAKSETYYYDAGAVREPGIRYEWPNQQYKNGDLTRHHGAPGNHAMNGDATAGRNKRSVWTVATQPYAEAHMATYPEDLIKPCILAGTSERGACVECGAPWERVVERKSVTPIDYEGKYLATDPNGAGRRMLANVRARRMAGEDHDNPFPNSKTLGWWPTCNHKPSAISHTLPCIVLDPFAGSGTTVKVSQDLGRIGIGLDLKPDYLKMAKRRSAQQGFSLPPPKSVL